MGLFGRKPVPASASGHLLLHDSALRSNPGRPVHVELAVSTDAFDTFYVCVCGLVVAKALAAFFRRGQLSTTLRAHVASVVEAGVYAFVYSAIALCFGGCVDAVFGACDGAAALPSVLLEVCLQAAANAVFAQLARYVVASLDMPGTGEHLAASGGGVIFAFLLFSRQANWKKKVPSRVCLAAALSLTARFVRSRSRARSWTATCRTACPPARASASRSS